MNHQHEQSIHYSSQLRYALFEVAICHLRLNRERRAIIPNMVIMKPEILFIQRSHCAFILCRSRLMHVVRIIHHSVEPVKTPSTTPAAERKLLLALPTPIPAKMAAKERIVSGLVSVSRNVEAYAPR